VERVVGRARDQCGEQVLYLVGGKRGQVIGCGVVPALGGGGDGQEGVGEHVHKWVKSGDVVYDG
jgi:hypothetical protein